MAVSALAAVVIVHSTSGRRQAVSAEQRGGAPNAWVLLNLDLRGDTLVYGSHLPGGSSALGGERDLDTLLAGLPGTTLATRAGALRVAAAAAELGDTPGAIEGLRMFPGDPELAALANGLAADEQSADYTLALNEATKLNPLWVRRAFRMALLERGTDTEAVSREEALIQSEAPSRMAKLAFPAAWFGLGLCPGIPALLVVLGYGLWRWRGRAPKPGPAVPDAPAREPALAVALLDGCEATVALLAAPIVVTETLAALTGGSPGAHLPGALSAALGYGGGMLAAAGVLRWRLGPTFARTVGYVQAKPLRVYLTTAVALSALAGAAAIVDLLMQLVGISPISQNPALALAARESGTLSRIVLFLVIAVAAPITEEAVFRGALYLPIRRGLGVAPAVAVTAVVFALAHRDPLVAPQLALVGIACAVAREVSASLTAPALLHAVWNGVTFLLLLVMCS